jgi:hypothetical protein
VWILVFDEMDYRLTFGETLNRVELPAFTRFKQETVSLSGATPPSKMTQSAIPSLLVGRSFRSAYALDAHTLELLPASGGRSIGWKGEGTLFHELDHRGRSLGVTGWYLPYGRLLSGTSAQVQDEPIAEEQARFNCYRGFLTSFLAHALDSLPIPGNPTKRFLVSKEDIATSHRETAQRFLKRLQALAEGPQNDYHWIHLPLPHEPAVLPGGSYLDNLKSADQLFASFRSALEARGTWDDCTVIVLADHWFRKPDELNLDAPPSWTAPVVDRWQVEDYRVPFLVKLPRQRESRSFSEPVNSAIIRNLVLTLDDGVIQTPDDLIQWLHSHCGEPPRISRYE